MPYGLYISAEGALAQGKRLEAIANNLANVDTVGFKRDLAIFQARYAEGVLNGDDYPGSRTINDLGGGVGLQQTKTDFSAGTLERTGIDTDMAIRGDGFFVVGKGNETYLTRSGNFVVRQGQLQTPDGYAVLSDSLSPIQLDEALPFSPHEAGGISQGGAVTLLALVRPESLGDLAKVGENLFRPLAPPQPLEEGERSVAPRHLERSTVRPTSEMMEMIEATRAFEANVNLIRSQDQMLGTLVGRI